MSERNYDASSGQDMKVAIIEDVCALREGFPVLTDGAEGFRCTGKFRAMEEALERQAMTCLTLC